MTVLAQHKLEIAEAFGRAAMNYDRHAEFQRDVVDRLVDSLPDDLSGIKALDVGSGTGYFAEKLLQRGAEVTCLISQVPCSHKQSKDWERPRNIALLMLSPFRLTTTTLIWWFPA